MHAFKNIYVLLLETFSVLGKVSFMFFRYVAMCVLGASSFGFLNT